MTALNPTMRVGRPGGRGAADPRHRAATARPRSGAPSTCWPRSACPTRPRRPAPTRTSCPAGSGSGWCSPSRSRTTRALLVCDEPTTALDVTVQAQVLDLIVSGVEARDAALLFITHDLAVVATACERVLVMYGGRIVEAGPVEEVFHRPRHRVHAGPARGVGPRRSRRRPAGCGRSRARCRRRASSRTAACSATAAPSPPSECATRPAVDRARPGAAGTRATTRPARPPTTMRSSRPDARRAAARSAGRPAGAASRSSSSRTWSATTSDRGRRLTRPGQTVHALRGVSFEVTPGERFGIVGESGSGKSTLLRLLAGLDRPTSGRVVVEGTDIAPLPERRLRFLRDRAADGVPGPDELAGPPDARPGHRRGAPCRPGQPRRRRPGSSSC